VRITYDRQSNAAYLHLTDQPPPARQATTRAQTPPGLDASTILPADLLDQAEIIS